MSRSVLELPSLSPSASAQPKALCCNYTFPSSLESFYLHVLATSNLVFLTENQHPVTIIQYRVTLVEHFLGVDIGLIISKSHNIPKIGLITPFYILKK